MRIGIPKEVKPLEGRVALIPPAVKELVTAGHDVAIEAGAGLASGYEDTDYQASGTRILPDADSLYAESRLIVKVKEPIKQEYSRLRAEHIIFSYLHLAAVPELAQVLKQKKLTAIAFETVEAGGRLPLLIPMSDIAGRLSVQIGTTLLHRPQGGRGLLLGGLPGAERGRVVILGAGSAGGNAATVAAQLGANVTVFSKSRASMERMRALGANVTALPSYEELVEKAVREADLLIGAVLVTGARSPQLVSRAMVKQMKPGSVIVDISVDQGGSIETTRPTDYSDPTYIDEGVVHFAVTNMPGAVPRTASQALSNELLPYVQMLAQGPESLKEPAIATGINVFDGQIVHPVVAESLAE